MKLSTRASTSFLNVASCRVPVAECGKRLLRQKVVDIKLYLLIIITRLRDIQPIKLHLAAVRLHYIGFKMLQ